MMVSIYHMISDKKCFNPCDYEELMAPGNPQPKVILNDKNVFAYLEAQGYDVSQLVKCSDNK